MKIGKVTGSVSLNKKASCLLEKTFLVVETQEGEVAAVDQVGAQMGDRVLLITGPVASRFCMEAPVDAAVVAVLEDK